MKATINGIEVEGEVDEFKQLLNLKKKYGTSKKYVSKYVPVAVRRAKSRSQSFSEASGVQKKRWTEAEAKQFQRLIRTGIPHRIIAEKLGRTKKAIEGRIQNIKTGKIKAR